MRGKINRGDEIVRWGEDLMGEILFVAICGTIVFCPRPLLKMLHTQVSHTQFLHCTVVALGMENKKHLAEKKDVAEKFYREYNKQKHENNKIRMSQNVTINGCYAVYAPMLASWLCCRENPRLCSCSELFPRLLRMFCPLGAHRIWSEHLHLGQGFLQKCHKNTKQHTMKTVHIVYVV